MPCRDRRPRRSAARFRPRTQAFPRCCRARRSFPSNACRWQAYERVKKPSGQQCPSLLLEEKVSPVHTLVTDVVEKVTISPAVWYKTQHFAAHHISQKSVPKCRFLPASPRGEAFFPVLYFFDSLQCLPVASIHRNSTRSYHAVAPGDQRLSRLPGGEPSLQRQSPVSHLLPDPPQLPDGAHILAFGRGDLRCRPIHRLHLA